MSPRKIVEHYVTIRLCFDPQPDDSENQPTHTNQDGKRRRKRRPRKSGNGPPRGLARLEQPADLEGRPPPAKRRRAESPQPRVKHRDQRRHKGEHSNYTTSHDQSAYCPFNSSNSRPLRETTSPRPMAGTKALSRNLGSDNGTEIVPSKPSPSSNTQNADEDLPKPQVNTASRKNVTSVVPSSKAPVARKHSTP